MKKIQILGDASVAVVEITEILKKAGFDLQGRPADIRILVIEDTLGPSVTSKEERILDAFRLSPEIIVTDLSQAETREAYEKTGSNLIDIQEFHKELLPVIDSIIA